jgi:NAD dependent epimerase/dehydratase family enzyme
MLPSFRAGLGGRLGSGKQIYSWVSLSDAIYALYHCMKKESLHGPVNVVSTGAVTQGDFARLLAQALKRWSFFSVPASVLRLILGERADALLLRSAKVKPLKLIHSGFTFLYDNLDLYFKSEL